MDFSLDKMYESAVSVSVNIAEALVIFIVGKWIAGMIAHFIHKAILRTHPHKTLASFTRNLTFYSIMTFVCITALNKLGVQTGSIIAVMGAASLAVGLALQGSLANFAAGVMLILFHPFEVGDTIDAGGVTGRVDEIQIFNTILYTQDEKKVIMPNGKITADKITVLLVGKSVA